MHDSCLLTNIISYLLKECPFLEGLESVDKENLPKYRHKDIIAAVKGTVSLAGQTVTLVVAFDSVFPDSLPFVFIRPSDALGFIPHVDANGYVCYAQNEGFLLNRYQPERIVEEAIEKAISVLESGLKGENHTHFQDEFEAYWRQFDHCRLAHSVIPPGKRITLIKAVGFDPTKDSRFYLTDEQSTLEDYSFSPLKPSNYRNAIYIPLIQNKNLLPPQPDEFWSCAQVREVVWASISSENAQKLRKLIIGMKPKWDELVLLSIPRPSGNYSFFGIHFHGVQDTHPLLEGGTVRELIPINIDRLDRSYLKARGGALTILSNKRVAVIGCGAVGGYIAQELAGAGVGHLTLVDPDEFRADNLYRHVLGKSSIGKPKVEALQEEITSKFPYMRIVAHAEPIERLIRTDTFDPDTYDLLIVALGDPSLSLYLNELFHDDKFYRPATLFAWLEAYGIGGHVLLTNNAESVGCLECLYTTSEGTTYNRASFAAPNQSFVKDLSGCGSVFTPFGNLDAIRTASLAVQTATEFLLGQEPGNPLVSWKGNSSAFTEAGKVLSPRYELTEDQLTEHRYNYAKYECRVCHKNWRSDG